MTCTASAEVSTIDAKGERVGVGAWRRGRRGEAEASESPPNGQYGASSLFPVSNVVAWRGRRTLGCFHSVARSAQESIAQSLPWVIPPYPISPERAAG